MATALLPKAKASSCHFSRTSPKIYYSHTILSTNTVRDIMSSNSVPNLPTNNLDLLAHHARHSNYHRCCPRRRRSGPSKLQPYGLYSRHGGGRNLLGRQVQRCRPVAEFREGGRDGYLFFLNLGFISYDTNSDRGNPQL